MPAADYFVLSFMTAMRDQLSAMLATLDPAPLNQEEIDRLERHHGVYELLHRDEAGDLHVMYVGKASDEPLPSRLTDHRLKITGRRNIDIGDMYFKCAYLEQDLDAVGPESVLIGHRRSGGDAPWNGRIGFGPHDPGKKRDTQDPPPWDVMYPVRLDEPLDVPAGRYELLDFLWTLKAALPFLFRFERVDRRRRSGHPDYDGRAVTVERNGLDALGLLALPTQVLPPGWRMSVLPGYAILYRDRGRSPVTLHEFESAASDETS